MCNLKIIEKINQILNDIETYNLKVLNVQKEKKNSFKQQFSDFIINPGRKIDNCTYITVESENIIIRNSSLFFYGLYIKKQRNVSQTPMPGVKNAVSDIFKPVITFFHADEFNFVPAGREDKDVLNIDGRPFYVEIKNPKYNLNIPVSSDLLSNEFVQLNHFTRVKEKEIKEFILKGEKTHKKIYSLYAYYSEKQDLRNLIISNIQVETKQIEIDNLKLNALLNKQIEIKQKTPLRVLHRRANLTRKKSVKILEYTKYDSYIYLKLESSAGTYIKEFVNGDFGRTNPSLSSLLNCFCDCVQLDVVEIENAILPDDCIFN